jgi:hypothetical protein
MIERWARTWWPGAFPKRQALRLPVHTHYCIDGDHRWPCRTDPCLHHDVWSCVEHNPLRT